MTGCAGGGRHGGRAGKAQQNGEQIHSHRRLGQQQKADDPEGAGGVKASQHLFHRETAAQVAGDHAAGHGGDAVNGEGVGDALLREAVGGDLGIALLPRFAVERQLADGTLQAVESDFSWESITAVCSHHKNKWFTPAMELFMALTREHFAALRQPEGQQEKYA